MDFLPLGNTGLKVSRLCLGCMSYGSSKARPWILDEEAALPFFQQALEAGINFFDTADLYSQGMSEEVTGRALQKLRVRREEVIIATKVFYPTGNTPNEQGTSKKHVRHAIDASLRRLGVDYIDLYQIHRYDRSTPMEETLGALTDLIHQRAEIFALPCGSGFSFQPLFASIRVHSRSGSNLPHSYTRREPILLFLSEFRDFQLTGRNRKRTTRMETATGRWI